MANTIRYIDDGSANHVFPVTHERGVLDSKGVNLETKLLRPLAEWHLDGNGNTAVIMSGAAVIPGHTYRFYVKSWPHDEITASSSNVLFGIYKNTFTSSNAIVRIAVGSDIASYYDVIAPDDCTALVLSGRINSSSEGVVVVEDITEVESVRDYAESVEEKGLESSLRPLTEIHIAGQGNTYVSQRCDSFYMGHTYRFYINSWAHDSVTSSSSNALFAVYSNNGSASNAILSISMGDTLAAYYDVSIPSDMVYITIGGRVNSGSVGVVVVEDMTAIIASVLNPQEWDAEVIDTANLPSYAGSMTSEGAHQTIGHHTRLYVEQDDIVYVKANGNYRTRVGLMGRVSANTSGATNQVKFFTQLQVGQDIYIRVPSGVAALFINTSDSNDNDQIPQSIIFYHSISLRNKKDLTAPIAIPVYSSRTLSPNTETTKLGGQPTDNSLFFRVRQGYRYHLEFSGKTNYGLFGCLVSNIPGSLVPYTDYSSKGIGDEGNAYYIAPADGFYVMAWRRETTTISLTVHEEPATEDMIVNTQDGVARLRGDVNALIHGLTFEAVDIMSLPKRSYYISADYGDYVSGSTTRHVIVPVTPGQFVHVQPNITTGYHTRLAWLASDAAPVAGAMPDYVTGTAMFMAYGQANTTLDYYYRAPVGAAFLHVYLGASPYNYAPSYVGLSSTAGGDVVSGASAADSQGHSLRALRDTQSKTMGLRPLTIPADSGWETPQTLQQLNSLKKALQMVKIKWTPLADLPGKNNGTHSANVEQTGIPYSGNWHEYKYVGIEVSIHTFMTSVHNPYSLLYTENISKTGSKSAWGKTYYNTNGWMYYGTVCCGFASSVNGQPTKYGNAVIPKAGKTFGVYVPLDPQNVEVLQLGDICNNSKHSIFIYGIHRTDGVIDKIKIAESTGAVNSCRLTTFNSVASFLTYLNYNGNPMIMYRCADLYRNIDYEPSPYVPLTDYGETAETVTYNDDICCFAGDKATFMAGDRIAVNYNLTVSPSHTWTAIEVYKDDVLLNTYTLANIDQSALDESQQNHALDLGTTLAAGKYKARMTDGTNYSDYTYWEVLPNSIVVTANGVGGYFIKNNSGKPMMYVYGGQTQEGGWFYNRIGREPDWYETEANQMLIYWDDLLTEWGFDPADSNQIRVMLKGDYGMAATPPITLPGRSDEPGDDDTPDDPSDDSNDNAS